MKGRILGQGGLGKHAVSLFPIHRDLWDNSGIRYGALPLRRAEHCALCPCEKGEGHRKMNE